jgi:hypothetical protein
MESVRTAQNPTKVSTVTDKGSEDVEAFTIDNISVDSNSKYWRDHDQRYADTNPNPLPLDSNNRYIEQNSSQNISSITDTKNSLNTENPPPQKHKNLNSIQELGQEEDCSNSQVDPNIKFQKSKPQKISKKQTQNALKIFSLPSETEQNFEGENMVSEQKLGQIKVSYGSG